MKRIAKKLKKIFNRSEPQNEVKLPKNWPNHEQHVYVPRPLNLKEMLFGIEAIDV